MFYLLFLKDVYSKKNKFLSLLMLERKYFRISDFGLINFILIFCLGFRSDSAISYATFQVYLVSNRHNLALIAYGLFFRLLSHGSEIKISLERKSFCGVFFYILIFIKTDIM